MILRRRYTRSGARAWLRVVQDEHERTSDLRWAFAAFAIARRGQVAPAPAWALRAVEAAGEEMLSNQEEIFGQRAAYGALMDYLIQNGQSQRDAAETLSLHGGGTRDREVSDSTLVRAHRWWRKYLGSPP
jgi:hypothetical protein